MVAFIVLRSNITCTSYANTKCNFPIHFNNYTVHTESFHRLEFRQLDRLKNIIHGSNVKKKQRRILKTFQFCHFRHFRYFRFWVHKNVQNGNKLTEQSSWSVFKRVKWWTKTRDNEDDNDKQKKKWRSASKAQSIVALAQRYYRIGNPNSFDERKFLSSYLLLTSVGCY